MRLIARKNEKGTNLAMKFVASLLRQVDYYRASGVAEAQGMGLFRAHRVFCSKECSMEFEEYDFIRIPVVQDQVFFLESKCVACELPGLVRSIEELVEHEQLHRTEYRLANALA
jgi:hypothetical protein